MRRLRRLRQFLNMLNLPKVVTKRKKRLGRGYGSGKGGHTVGRGQKGQKTRAKIGVLFEGIKVKKSLLKKLPLRRGKDKFKARNKPLIVKLSYLNLLASGTKVDIPTLIKEKIIDAADAKEYGVKILGGGEVTKKFTISVPISKSAAKVVEKAGGKIAKI
ncbi:MAG: 50S ribosomal protein L15 [Candidatus Woesebacteria bacterium GW2011_GWA1_40_45]|uniref:Large ribosomal subunit protein uL15 n=5 Tax=Candidatus Woeseibacteriota TaxID=1752722 RepID=A0A0G0SFC9_9BACT|nr:MAG: 50S ribosomal protein L15 [Candidatus Woesebacteria bacterium GW2011_GWB1_40_101]KKR63593.1 MAG: 50S ribosomal protein L15 [Candidatus Woesebacteria bacterium GW2011_GWA1_40_45]